MPTYDWLPLLQEWNRKLLETEEYRQNIPPEVIASGWVGYPGATEAQLVQAEARLGVTLPPSYCEFLSITNGWRQIIWYIGKLWSTKEINWFAVRHQDWINAFLLGYGDAIPIADEHYLMYGEAQEEAFFRVEYLQTALEVSDVGDEAIYLLNPQIVTPDGEWEAWFFANWNPGARRYRSFWEMMQAEYRSFLSLRDL